MNDNRLNLNSSREGRARAAHLFTHLMPFANSNGTLRGEVGPAFRTGWLPGEYRESARSAIYVVWSYDTPILWVTADGQEHLPSVRYSATTSKHQGVARGFRPVIAPPPSGTGSLF